MRLVPLVRFVQITAKNHFLSRPPPAGRSSFLELPHDGQAEFKGTLRPQAEESRVKILLTAENLREGIQRMAREIRQAYDTRPVTMLGIMTGSVVLLADLIREFDMPLRVGVLQASSYRGGTTRGELIVNADLLPDVSGRDILLVDDIFDTGRTLAGICERIERLGANSVRTAVLLRKRGRQEVTLVPDFVGFEIPDEFVVGYGLDYRDEYRNLSYVAALDSVEIARPMS